MIRHRHLLSLVVCAFVAAQSSLPVWGVQYAIVAPQSSYVYFIPPEGPGIAGCLPDAFHCRSGLAGSFEFNVANGQGTFVDPDLVLSDVEGGTATLLEQVLTA